MFNSLAWIGGVRPWTAETAETTERLQNRLQNSAHEIFALAVFKSVFIDGSPGGLARGTT